MQRQFISGPTLNIIILLTLSCSINLMQVIGLRVILYTFRGTWTVRLKHSIPLCYLLVTRNIYIVYSVWNNYTVSKLWDATRLWDRCWSGEAFQERSSFYAFEFKNHPMNAATPPDVRCTRLTLTVLSQITSSHSRDHKETPQVKVLIFNSPGRIYIMDLIWIIL